MSRQLTLERAQAGDVLRIRNSLWDVTVVLMGLFMSIERLRQLWGDFRSSRKQQQLLDRLYFTPDHPVVVCTYGLGPGGSERQWVYLAKALARRGIPCTFVTYEPLLGPQRHYLPQLVESGIPLFDASLIEAENTVKLSALAAKFKFPQREMESISRLVKAFRRLTPRIIYSQLDEPNVFSAIAAKLSGVTRLVMSFRSHDPTNFDYILRPWMLPAYRWIANWEEVRLTGNSAAGIKSYAHWMGIPESRITHVPNTVGDFVCEAPGSQAIEAIRRELDLKVSDTVILGVFRLSKEKRPQDFLRVCSKVLREFPLAKFLIAGDGPLKLKLTALARELEIQNNLRILGHRSDVKALMKLSTFLLHTSVLEGMSNVLMEAQASRLPVVAYHLPGIAATVQESKSAILCPTGAIGCLTSACKKLLRDPTRCRKMGAAGQRFVLSQFGEEAFCSKYLEIGMGP